MFMYVLAGIFGLMVVGVIIIMVIVIKNPDFFNKNTIKKETLQERDAVYSNDAMGDTKDFLPFDKLEDYAIDLGGFNYRAIIECSSLNFFLMTATEQEIVEASYRQFLNSLSFPVEFYTQTREYDQKTMLDNIENNIYRTQKRYPDIKEYANMYYSEMSRLTQYTGNSKVKKNFIIVPYDCSDLTDVSELNEQEIREFELEELMNRCAIVVSGLERVGLQAILLNKKGLAECIYAYYHRNDYQLAMGIIDGEFNSLVINSDSDPDKDAAFTINVILTEALNKFKNEFNKQDNTSEEITLYKFVCEKIDEIQQNLSFKNSGDQTYSGNVGELEDFVKTNLSGIVFHPIG